MKSVSNPTRERGSDTFSASLETRLGAVYGKLSIIKSYVGTLGKRAPKRVHVYLLLGG